MAFRREELADGVTLYCGDCLEVLPTLEAGSVDAVVTDPPYGKQYYQTDVIVMTGALLTRFCEIGDTAMFGYPEALIGLCIEAGKVPDEWITWWPTNGRLRGFNLHGLLRESEAIAVFGKADWNRMPRVPRKPECARFVEKNYRSVKGDILHDWRNPSGARPGDVWRDSSPGLGMNSHLRQHPNEKPIGIMANFVLALASGGQTVLDPFMGSGTTGVACVQTGRKFIGIEIDEGYYAIAKKRISDALMQMRLPLEEAQ